MARRRAPGPSVAELMKQVEIELRHVRAVVKDVLKNCEARLHAQIEQAASDLLRAVPSAPGAAGMRKRESLLKEALKSIAGLRIKPEKGRTRDVKRLHKLADGLTDLATRMQ